MVLKEKIRKILRERQLELDLKSKEYGPDYERCSYFSYNTKYQEFCKELSGFRSFLHNDLGLKDIIDEKIKLMGEIKNLNQQYQEPLSLLYGNPNFKEIQKVGDEYYLKHLDDKSVLFDEDGNWHYVNKLNTNYSDLAELLTELFIRTGEIKKIVDKNKLYLRKYLQSKKEDLKRLLDEHFSLDEYKDFVRNTKVLSRVGEKAEDDVREILEKAGFRTLYQGGHGDFIDMVFGVDLIMEYNGKIVTIQVKNNDSVILDDSNDYSYRRLDYMAAPTIFGMVIKNRDGLITKLDENGEIISDPK